MPKFGFCSNCGSHLRILDKRTLPHFQAVDGQRQELLEEQQSLAEQLVRGIRNLTEGVEDVNALVVRQNAVYAQWEKIVLKLTKTKM
jgi:hypothetical protein